MVVGLAWAGVGGYLVLRSLTGDAASTGRPESMAFGQAGRLQSVLGDPKTSGARDWPGQFDVSPTTYDFDRDGTDEVIAQSNDTKVYVFDAGGRILARLDTHYPPGWYIERVLNPVAVGVLRPGEAPTIVVTDHAAQVTAWRFDPGASNDKSFKFTRSWERRLSTCHAEPSMDAGPVLADLDGDKTLEILAQTEEEGFYALKADGSEMWRQCWAGGNSAPQASDLDGDGSIEYIVASDSGFISVLAGKTGAPLWTFDATAFDVKPASISVAPTIAELDGVPPKEILFTVRDARSGDPATFKNSHMAIFAVHQNLQTYQPEVLWMRQPTWANPLSYTRLVVTDADGDGRADIFGMDWNTIGHQPGNWEDLGESHVFRLAADGSDVWVQKTQSWWSNKEIAVADVDRDGRVDILVEGQRGGFSGMYRLRVSDGDPQAFTPAGTAMQEPFAAWKAMRGPTLADLNHDGRPELLYPVLPDDGQTRRGAILIFEL